MLPLLPTEFLAEKSGLSGAVDAAPPDQSGRVDQVSAPQSLKTDNARGRFSKSCVLPQTRSPQISPWAGFHLKAKERSLILLALDSRSLVGSFGGLQELSSSPTSSPFSRSKTLFHQSPSSRKEPRASFLSLRSYSLKTYITQDKTDPSLLCSTLVLWDKVLPDLHALSQNCGPERLNELPKIPGY